MSKVQNVAVVGHGTCGKTTLVEEILFRGKSIPRAGKVDDGTSILDSSAPEKDRHFTIESSLGSIEHGGKRLQLIDTPGYPDFLSAAVDALSAVETALVAVDAAQGIRVNTKRVWEEANKLHVARMIVVTRLDVDNADFAARVSEIQDTFGNQCVPMFLPNASGGDVASVESTYHLTESSSAEAKSINSQITESVVEADEDLMERYLADEEIKSEEVDAVFVRALLSGTIVPIFPVSTTKGIGVDELVEALWALLPQSDAPHQLPLESLEGEPVDEGANGSADDPFFARVFKVVLDPFVGKLSYLRIHSGTATPNMNVINLSKGSKDRLTNLLRMQGKEQSTIDSSGPGEIIAVPKVESFAIGESVGDAAQHKRFAALPRPRSMVKMAVEAKNRNDETKLTEALNKLAESDSAFSAERIAQTHELVISGRSQLHLDIMLSRLDVEVETHVPKTAYLESINGSSESHHKHKKQSGGRGQFGEVYLKMEKGEKGSGLEFVNAIVGGVIPGQFLPAIEKGIRETMDTGILAGCPILDVKVTCYDGSFHPVDSSEAAFKTAGREAFKKAFMAAKPCLLEPILEIEIHVPSQFLGDIMSDLNSRRAHISGMDADGEDQIIKAVVPESEVKRYSIDLRSITGGEGAYSLEFSHYDIVPAAQQAQILREIEASKVAEAAS